MHRYFLSKQEFDNKSLDQEKIFHLFKVIKLTKGEKIEIVCEQKLFEAILIDVSKKQVTFDLIKERKNPPQLTFYAHVLIAIGKEQRFKWILEKLVELGVSEITPIITKRSNVKINLESKNKKLTRWKKIILSAARQSKRLLIPQINEIIMLDKIRTNKLECNLVAHEGYDKVSHTTLKKSLQNLKTKQKVNLISGPEGGFSDEEINFLIKNHFQVVSLGHTILRYETAPLFVLSSLIYEKEL